jgi:hypothetical protein
MAPVQTCLVVAFGLVVFGLGYLVAWARARNELRLQRELSVALGNWVEQLRDTLLDERRADRRRALLDSFPPPLPRYFTVKAPRDALLTRRTAGFSLPRFKLADEQPSPR